MKCKECHGSGESAYPPYSETDPYGDLVNCRSCNGTGIAYPKHIWLEQATALISDESGHHWVDYKQPDGHKIEYVRADLYAELQAAYDHTVEDNVDLVAKLDDVKREIEYLKNVKPGDNAVAWTADNKMAMVNVLSVVDMFSRAIEEQEQGDVNTT